MSNSGTGGGGGCWKHHGYDIVALPVCTNVIQVEKNIPSETAIFFFLHTKMAYSRENKSH